ncbi:MAG: VWA domain-containing protein [Candidatus Omnitrophica bacterium]|nr:VWA domain-containing protein [Candidatus Omnitrophota bacterium]
MRFGLPYMSILLWLVPLLVVFYFLAAKMRKKTMERFAESPLLVEIASDADRRRRNISSAIIVVSVFLIVLSLMRPQWGFQWREVERRGIDIVIALDTSKSMLAEDVLPNRLERAKLGIKDLVRKLKGDRIGLVVFSGTAFLQCPLTVDYNGFLLSLDDVTVDTIPVGGTSLANAIYTAMKSYEGGGKKNKILIVITDGEDLEGGVDKAIAMAKHEGVRIFAVGIGAIEGELIPVTGKEGRRVFLKDQKGNVVKTSLREDVLQKMAIETNGMYVRATGGEFGLDLIYEKELSKLEKEELKSRMEKRYHERYQYFLGLALLLLFIEPFIGDSRRKDRAFVK